MAAYICFIIIKVELLFLCVHIVYDLFYQEADIIDQNFMKLNNIKHRVLKIQCPIRLKYYLWTYKENIFAHVASYLVIDQWTWGDTIFCKIN